MIHPTIRSHHLERDSYVYLRQSRPGQVRKNREGQQRQQVRVDHVAILGWLRWETRLMEPIPKMPWEVVVKDKAGQVNVRELS
jgi:hypothetical protein